MIGISYYEARELALSEFPFQATGGEHEEYLAAYLGSGGEVILTTGYGNPHIVGYQTLVVKYGESYEIPFDSSYNLAFINECQAAELVASIPSHQEIVEMWDADGETIQVGHGGAFSRALVEWYDASLTDYVPTEDDRYLSGLSVLEILGGAL